MTDLVWMALAFLSGSIPYAVWVGYLILKRDIRRYGDGNPGAYNVFRAGGRVSGVVAGVLDALKGAVPTYLALHSLGPARVPGVAVAAIAGHAFSPWLRFRGGKAVAVSLGVWAALSTMVPAFWVLALALLVWLSLVRSHAWVVVLGFLTLGLWLFWRDSGLWLLSTWSGDMMILVWKHRHDLRREAPALRPWIRQRLPAALRPSRR